MLSIVKLALRITTTAFDTELTRLISECIEEMTGLGVVINLQDGVPSSDQVKGTIVAYCKWQFGSSDEKDAWRDIYERKLSQLKTMTGFTVWGD